ncbi:MAG: hypothetical protein DRN15_08090 [Thermoprotei archaeon]|nr:MAG: hypothetical protein DRN15_08090 [Thermoprotei archaeon]
MRYDLLLLSFMAGILTFTSPCSMPLIPVFIAHIMKLRPSKDMLSSVVKSLGISLVAGMTSALTLAVLSFVAIITLMKAREVATWIDVLLALILIMMGVLMLKGFKIVIPQWSRFGPISGRSAYLTSLLYGLTYALVSMSCSLPILLMFISTSIKARSYLEATLLLASYMAGLVIPFMAIGTLTALSRDLAVRCSRSIAQYIDRVSALLLIMAGVYLLALSFAA